MIRWTCPPYQKCTPRYSRRPLVRGRFAVGVARFVTALPLDAGDFLSLLLLLFAEALFIALLKTTDLTRQSAEPWCCRTQTE